MIHRTVSPETMPWLHECIQRNEHQYFGIYSQFFDRYSGIDEELVTPQYYHMVRESAQRAADEMWSDQWNWTSNA